MSSRSRASINRSRCSNVEVTVCCRESYSGLSQKDRVESFLSLCSRFPQERFSLGRVGQCQRRQCRYPELYSYTFPETGHLRKSESCFSYSCSHYWLSL